MNILKTLHISAVTKALVAAALFAGATSCGAVYDDMPPCESGVQLRFIYDYHMERGNAFMYNVDCLTVYFYNSKGTLVATKTETSECLADENWRMDVELPAGTYHAVAYGGMACDEASFEHIGGIQPAQGDAHASLGAVLKTGLHIGDNKQAPLHDHFWGAVDFTVKGNSLVRDEATVEMRKNTNNIRIVLQHLSGEPVDPDMFNFTLHADNTHMAADNSLVSKGTTVYTPWATGQTELGMLQDGTPLMNAYAQFSTSRLVENPGANPKIRVTKVTDASRADDEDNTVFDLDLIYLIKLARQQHEVKDMPLQEYLDRESRWSFIFLLDKNNDYYNLRIKVNDWEVRFNHIES